ncbi:TonB-dependent receptor [Oleiagrimonas sp. C23AA]|uniref:TonB-dependent receptor n=1 Tax=Oleiagrimonas sp. C23AA TaxID=2719047 RepID=UPI001424502E|nr:TonB-dependent receptor [Oleiagrimonas sp. C23AA]NII11847.1 hypothetical protein [Oleiagrimonas sp. C23AA]
MSFHAKHMRTRPVFRIQINSLAALLAICLGVSTGTLHAQTATGGLSGYIATSDKNVIVTIHNLDTGKNLQRKPNDNGQYILGSLSPGEYVVTAHANGHALGKKRVVQVVAGSTTRVPEIGATALAAVSVSAQSVNAGFINPIDVTTPQLSTIVSAQLTNELSQTRSAKSVANSFLSQVSTVGSGYPRFNGASGGENRYYVNGFDTTRGKTGIDLTGIPGEAMASEQIIGDSASARYSNAMGGSMAQTVKQGSNKFKAGYDVYYTPGSSKLLRPHGRNYRYPDGSYYTFNNGHAGASTNQFLWASGALVKDKLFFYVLLNDTPPSKSRSVDTSGSTQTVSSGREKRPLVNLTWNITGNQVLDVLDTENFQRGFSTAYSLSKKYDTSDKTFKSWSDSYYKEKVLIGNYHWYINDDMTLTLMGGRLSNGSGGRTNAEGLGGPFARQYSLDDRSSEVISANPSSSSLIPSTYYELGYRGDFEWTPGNHKISFGLEKYTIGFSNLAINGANGEYHYHEYSSTTTLPNGAVVPAYTPFVDSQYSRSGGNFYSVNRGAFLQDYWQVARNVVLYMGVRRDQTIGHEINGDTYLDLLTTTPRIGLAWDMFGDGSTKLGFNAGQYTIPLPAGLDSSVGGDTVATTDYYAYSGMNPDGSPRIISKYGSTVTTGSGKPTAAQTIASRNIRNTYQNNFTVYIQHRFSRVWQGTVQAKYDVLKRIVEDTCDLGEDSPAYRYLRSQGYADPKISNSCVLYNPGSDLVLTNDFNGDGSMETVKIPSSVYRMPHVKRKNYQLIGTLTHAYSQSEPYFLNVSYTWSHIYGNDPGVIDALHGQDNENATHNFDYPQLEIGATGNLDSDAKNSLKINGYYKFAGSGVRLGGNLDFYTGIPRNCNSYYPNTEQTASGRAVQTYANATWFCFDKVTPRGSIGRLPNYLDVGFFIGWTIRLGSNKLDMSVNVDNPFNWQRVTSTNHDWNTGQTGSGSYNNLNPSYDYPSFQGARSARFTLRYTWE